MAEEREAIHPSSYRYWIAGGAGVALVLALVLAPYFYKEFKLWRAENLAGEALELWEEDLHSQGKERASAAYLLAPENTEVLRVLAIILSETDDPGALSVWTKLDEMGALREDEDRRIYARTALKFGRSNLALQIMRPLMERENPQSKDLLFAQELAMKSGVREYVEQAGKRLREGEAVSAEDKLRQAGSLMQLGNEEDTVAALEILQGLKEEESGVGLRALTMIAGGQRFPREVRLDALGGIVTRDDIPRELYFQAQTARVELDPDRRDEIITEVSQELLMEDVETLVLLGRWLNQVGAYEKVLEVISHEDALGRKDLFGIRMDAVSALGRWDRIHEILLEESRLPILDFHRQLYLFRAHMELGNSGDAAFRWENALLPGSDQVTRLNFAGSYAERLGYYEFAQRAYERLAKNPATAMDGYVAMIRMRRSRDDAQGMLALYKDIKEAFPHKDAVQNDLNYYRVLLDEEVSQSVVSMRELYDSDPSMMAYRVHFAFALVVLGHPETSEVLLDIKGLEWRRLQNQWKYIRYLSLLANERFEEAKAFESYVDFGELLSEERALIERFQSSNSSD